MFPCTMEGHALQSLVHVFHKIGRLCGVEFHAGRHPAHLHVYLCIPLLRFKEVVDGPLVHTFKQMADFNHESGQLLSGPFFLLFPLLEARTEQLHLRGFFGLRNLKHRIPQVEKGRVGILVVFNTWSDHHIVRQYGKRALAVHLLKRRQVYYAY